MVLLGISVRFQSLNSVVKGRLRFQGARHSYGGQRHTLRRESLGRPYRMLLMVH